MEAIDLDWGKKSVRNAIEEIDWQGACLIDPMVLDSLSPAIKKMFCKCEDTDISSTMLLGVNMLYQRQYTSSYNTFGYLWDHLFTIINVNSPETILNAQDMYEKWTKSLMFWEIHTPWTYSNTNKHLDSKRIFCSRATQILLHDIHMQEKKNKVYNLSQYIKRRVAISLSGKAIDFELTLKNVSDFINSNIVDMDYDDFANQQEET